VDRTITTNGITLHAIERAGDEPPITLLPGLTANAHAFDGLIAAGLSPQFRTIAFDLRGRGQSDQPPHGYRLADHAADLIDALDALGLDRVVLAGHSFGGLLTLYLGSQQPERFPHLVVIDAAIAAAHPRTVQSIRPALARLERVYPSWEAYWETMRAAPYYNGWWHPLLEAYYRADVTIHADGSVQPRSRPTTIAQVIDGVLAEDWNALVAAIRQPTLLINAPGAYGPPNSPPVLAADDARATVAALADGRYIKVSGNHMTMLYGAGAAQIVDAITAFVRQGRIAKSDPGGEEPASIHPKPDQGEPHE
jgi:pimeloyl-ACP methyl ester carboxylesterase